MNQSILFNDDLTFDSQEDAWRLTGQIAGQRIIIYFHSVQLKQLAEIDNCTKYDLEEITELWLESNELEGDTLHIDV
ncbi:hypothetical protein [Litorilituus sediminis]|uniref:Uncharacterized protein n=1 Tax=Litorilituus sediminis TaxID=718192 RepID=A0A4P6P5K2_9GAMM|nr:hypothetical protein [Litorilituus sediminis]QBG36268.1 hypothetical protein EMK97_11385 [Litorilituus sediminis]